MKKLLSVFLAIIITLSCFTLLFSVSAAETYKKPTDKWILEKRTEYKNILLENANNVDKDGNYYITIWENRTETDDPWFESYLITRGFGMKPAKQTIIKYNEEKDALEYKYINLSTFNISSGSGYNTIPGSYSIYVHTYTMTLSLINVEDKVVIEDFTEDYNRIFKNGKFDREDNTSKTDIISFDAKNYVRNCEKELNGISTNDMNLNNRIHTVISAFNTLMTYDGYNIYNVGFCKLCPGHSTNTETVAATCTTKGYTAKVCRYCGQYYVLNEIAKKDHTYKSSKVTTKASISENGTLKYKCIQCGKTKEKTIARIDTIKLSKTAYTYTGKAIKPKVTVKDSKGKTISSSNYTVSYKSNTKVGKATVTVTFKGNYTGKKTLTFKINPKSTTIKKVTGKSKAVSVSWKKQATQTSGYQIQYSTSKKFTSSSTKIITVSGSDKTAKTISKLKGSKTYYVRIRTYKKISNTKYYSAWSAAKSGKTKK